MEEPVLIWWQTIHVNVSWAMKGTHVKVSKMKTKQKIMILCRGLISSSLAAVVVVEVVVVVIVVVVVVVVVVAAVVVVVVVVVVTAAPPPPPPVVVAAPAPANMTKSHLDVRSIKGKKMLI